MLMTNQFLALVFGIFLWTILPLHAGNPTDVTPVVPPKDPAALGAADGRANPCPPRTDEAEPGSITYSIPFGGIPYETGLDAGYLILRERLPTPSLFSPSVFFYQHPAAVQLVSLQGSSSGTLVTVIGADSISTVFKVSLGQLFGGATGDNIDSRQCIELLDASRQILPGATSVVGVAFVRILYADGDQVELSASTKRPTRFRSSTGRETVFADLPPEVALNVIYQDGALRQIRSATGLADFVSLGTTGFEIRFYISANQGAINSGTGLYIPINTPYRTLRFENPFATAKTYNRMVITDTWGTRVKLSTFDYDSIINDWTLLQGSGDEIRKQSKTLTPGPLAGQSTYHIVLRNSLEQVVSSHDEIWQTNFPWGSELVSETREPGSLNLRTDYDYNFSATANDPSYGRLRRRTNPDGSWEHFTYAVDGRLITKEMTWKDAPYSTNTNDPRVILDYAYTPHDLVDIVAASDYKPRTETESIITVSGAVPVVTKRTYWVNKFDASGSRIEIEERAASPSAAYGDPANLRTTRVYYTANPAQPGYQAAASGRLAYFDAADGTRTSYTYTLNLAAPLEAFVINAIRSVATQPAGVDGFSTRTDIYHDLRGNVVRTQAYLRSGGAWIATANEISTYNGEGFHTATHLNGRQTYAAAYDGRLLSSATDEQGVTTSYVYDPLGKVGATVRSAVPASGNYPAQAAVATIYNRDLGGLDCGCDGQVITTTTAGTLSLEEITRKDPLGRPQYQKDASGYETTFDYTLGGRQATQINPDNGTVITLRHADGRPRSTTGTGIVSSYYDYGVYPDGTRWTETRTGSPASPRWARITTDFLGRTLRTEQPAYDGGILETSYLYNPQGRLLRQRQRQVAPVTLIESTAVADTLYEYDDFGNISRTGLDINQNGVLDPASTDRLIDYGQTFSQYESAWWRVRTASVYPQVNSATTVQTSEERTRLTGWTGTLAAEQVTLDIYGHATRSVAAIDFAAKLVTQSVTVPGASVPATSVSYHGRLVARTTATVSTPATFAYDDLGRLLAIKTPRHALAATVAYVPGKSQILTQTDPHGQPTTFAYYPPNVPGAGQVSVVTDALGRTTRTAFDLLGRSIRHWGTASYPQHTTFDVYGAQETLTTWRDTGSANLDAPAWPSPSGGDTTTWVYHPATGLLTRKQYADGQGTDYGYDSFNRLQVRTWARTASLPVPGSALTTTYSYTPLTGERSGTDYSDATPDVSFIYDRLGRADSITDATGLRSFSYDPTFLHLAVENLPSVYFGGRLLTRAYEPSTGAGLLLGRAAGYQLGTTTTLDQDTAANYTYAETGRLQSVISPAGSFTYEYSPGSDLLSSVSGPQLVTSFLYEPNRDLRTEVKNQVGATVISRYAYTHDAIGRRQSRVQEGSAYAAATHDVFGYNLRSEVTSTRRYAGADPQVPGAEDAPLARAYTFDPIGNRLTSRKGTELEIPYISNSTNFYTSFGSVPSVVNQSSDPDGNQTATGTGWFYEWDGENRLRRARDYDLAPLNGSQQIDYSYDFQSRRIRKTLRQYNDGVWAVQEDKKFIYDGWNVVAEFDARLSGFSLQVSYCWGLDASGSLQGAGGVAGLLAVTTGGVNFYPSYDANCNITQYINVQGSVEAHFEYDAFGQISVSAGTNLSRFPYRFSTKPIEFQSGFYYYGLRFYDCTSGRFVNRDPIAESGGNNLYCFARNSAIGRIDVLGLVACCGSTPYDPTYFICSGGRLIPRQNNNNLVENPFVLGFIDWFFGEGSSLPGYLMNTPFGDFVRSMDDGTDDFEAAFQNRLDGYYVEAALHGLVALGQAASSTLNVVPSGTPWSRAPKTLQDLMALEASQKGAGTKIMDNLGDPNFRGMEKWEYKIKSSEGRDSVVHYVRDPNTGELMDFKFKKHSDDVPTLYERTPEPSVSSGNR